jgi:hypothetical protein
MLFVLINTSSSSCFEKVFFDLSRLAHCHSNFASSGFAAAVKTKNEYFNYLNIIYAIRQPNWPLCDPHNT